MATRLSILVLTDLRAALPTTVQPFAGIDRYVHERAAGWDLTVEPRPPRTLGEGQPPFHGIIGRVTPDAAAFARRSQIPLVNTMGSSPVRDVPHVVPDFEAAGRLGAEFLAERGFRRLVFFGTNLPFSDVLSQGFRSAAAALRLQCSFVKEKWLFDRNAAAFDAFMRRTKKLVDSLHPPVGIFGFDDFACRHIVRACEARGFMVPHDIAVLGLTNTVMACMHPPPSLSSIDLNLEMVGYRAAELLDALMAGKKPPDGPILIPPLGVVPRRSTDRFIVEDETLAMALRFIATRFSAPLRISQIAQHVAASERTLQRRFADILGHSIAREISLQRMQRAKQLLADTDKLVKQIAHDCGFPDSQQFCRAFLRHECVSPTKYRSRYRT